MLIIIVSLVQVPFLTYVGAKGDPMILRGEDLTITKDIRLFGFYDREYHHIISYHFGMNGSLRVFDNLGNEFKIGFPSFEFALSKLDRSLYSNSSHVLQRFSVDSLLEKTVLSLDVLYDFASREDGCKITLSGSALQDIRLKYQILPTTKTLKIGDRRARIGELMYDWNDAPSNVMFNSKESKLEFPLGTSFFIDPVIVSTLSNVDAIRYQCQRTAFYSQGRHWIFYCNGSDIVYKTSTDGTTWTSETFVHTINGGAYFSLFYNGSTVSYSVASGSDIDYRCGTPQSDGTISWIDSEYSFGLSDMVSPTITVDADGYPWIAVTNTSGGLGSYYPQIFRSKWNNGSWSTDTGFPKNITSTEGTMYLMSLSPISGKQVYVVYVENFNRARGKLYDWDAQNVGSEETLETISILFFSTVATDNGNVYLAYTDANGKVKLNIRSAGSWGTPDEIASIYAYPQLTKDGNDYYIYYGWGNEIRSRAYFNNGTSKETDIDLPYGYQADQIQTYYDGSSSLGAFYLAHETTGTYNLYFTEPSFGDAPSIPDPVGSFTTGTDTTTENATTTITAPISKLPTWGLAVVVGGVGIFMFSAIWKKLSRPTRRKPSGVQKSKAPQKQIRKTPKSPSKRVPRKPKRSKRTGRFV